MKPCYLRLGAALTFLISTEAHAEKWVRYYETFSCPELPGMCKGGTNFVAKRCTCTRSQLVSDTQYYVDSDSLEPEGNLLRYRTKIVSSDPPAGTQTFDMIVDCAAKKRGQLPSHDLYDTFDDTMAGNELKAACELARQTRRPT